MISLQSIALLIKFCVKELNSEHPNLIITDNNKNSNLSVFFSHCLLDYRFVTNWWYYLLQNYHALGDTKSDGYLSVKLSPSARSPCDSTMGISLFVWTSLSHLREVKGRWRDPGRKDHAVTVVFRHHF